MLRRATVLALLSGVLLAGGVARADVELDVWLRDGRALFVQSPQVERIKAEQSASRFAMESYAAGLPLEVGAGLSSGLYNPRPKADLDLARFRLPASIEPEVTLRQRTLLGLDSDVRVSVPYGYVPLTDGREASAQQLPIHVEASVSYDLLRGGPEGALWTDARARAKSAEAQVAALEQQLLEHRVSHQRFLLNVFVNACKLKELHAQRAQIERAVEEGRVRAETKTLPYTEYLNLLDLENSFARRIASLEATQRATLEQGLVFGAATIEHARRLSVDPPRCEPSLSDRLESVRERLRALGDIEPVAASLPSAEAPRHAIEAVELERRGFELRQTFSLSPFLRGTLTRPYDAPSEALAQPTWSMNGGVFGTWEIPSERRSAERSSLDARARAAELDAELAVLANVSSLRQLITQLEAQEQIYRSLERSLASSQELLDALETQRAIGMIDSQTLTSATLNTLETRFALLDTWATVEGGLWELELYLTGGGRE